MNLNSLFVKSLSTRLQLINYQTVRWRRHKKPFWLGIAKSKKFVIPQAKVHRTAEERQEIIKLKQHYETHMKSILNFIRNESPLEAAAAAGDSKTLSSSIAEVASKSWTVNEAFNAESARRREERMKEEEKEQVKRALEEIESIEEDKRKRLEIIEEIVRKEKVLSQLYVTPENVDEAIENCLKNVQTFDFAIDLDGKRYPGREAFQLEKEDVKVKVAESSSG